jgi:hypothetical protein
MPIIGLDVHKRVVQAARVDDHGRVLGQHRFSCTRAALLEFCAAYVTPDTRIALEATTHLGDRRRARAPLHRSGVFFRRLAKRKNRNVAVVACARKLVTIAWHMLKNNEPYRYAQPRVTEGKLARLRVKSGTKRKRGPAKGQARAAHYGSGERTRRVPSIGEVYEREGLPPVAPSSVGERRTVQRSGTGPYVQSIQAPQRISRRGKADAVPDATSDN